jgi:hypothetical protein
MPVGNRKQTILLAALLLAVFVCSLAYAFGFRVKPVEDARWYDTIAWNLASGKGFRLLDTGTLAEDPAIGTVGPGYEYVLAGVYGIFGRHLEPVWILQSLLHTLNALFVFFLARRVIPESPRRFFFAFLAAAFYGLNPDLILMAAMLFTETLYLTLLLLAALGMSACADHPTVKAALGTAAALACAILVRPIALLPLAVFLVLLIVKKKPLWAVGVVVIQVLAIAPWAWRNTVLYGRFVPLTAAGGYDLWVGNNPQADGEEIPAPFVSEYKDQYGFLAADRHGAEQYVQFLVQSPVRFLELQGMKTVKFFSVLRTSAWWFHLSGIARAATFFLSAGFFILLLLFGIPGIYSSLRAGPGPARILSALALSVPLAVIPIVVTSRLRYPMYPFLAVLGALAAFRLREGELPRRSVLLTAGVIFAVALMDIVISAPQIPDRILRLFS